MRQRRDGDGISASQCRRRSGPLLALLISPLLFGCYWYQNYAVPEPQLPPDPPEHGSEGDGGPPPAGGNSTEGGSMVLSELAYLPPQAVDKQFPGGLRAVARSFFSQGRSGAAYLQLTIPSPGSRVYGLPMLLAETLASAKRAGNTESLRTALGRLGGELRVQADHISTRFSISVPSERWHDALRRLVATFDRVEIKRDVIEEVQRFLLADLSNTLTNKPKDAIVGRFLDHRELGSEARYAQLQDIDPSQVEAAFADGYASQGSVLSMVVPNTQAQTLLRQAEIIMRPWAGSEIEAAPEQSTAGLQVGIYWAPTKIDRSTLILMLESPDTEGIEAAARLTAMQALTGRGIGGRFGEILGQMFPHEVGFATEMAQRGERQYLVLSAEVASGQVLSIINGFNSAIASMLDEAPHAEAISRAANQVRMRLLLQQESPEDWLDWSTRMTQKGLNLEPAYRQTLAALERPTSIPLGAAFTSLATAEQTWIVLGGRPPLGNESIGLLDDNAFTRGPASVSEASKPLQAALADTVMTKALDAMGGGNRILGITGYAAKSKTIGSSSIEFEDSDWYDVSGRLRRSREILNTSIDTRIDGPKADEKSGDEIKGLDASEADRILAKVRRHPLLLLQAYLLGKDQYRLVAMRTAGDRQVAILELIDRTKPRFRMHIDQGSGLVRAVETSTEIPELGVLQILESYRDYRNVTGLRVPFQCSTKTSGASGDSETIWQSFELGDQADEVFERSEGER